MLKLYIDMMFSYPVEATGGVALECVSEDGDRRWLFTGIPVVDFLYRLGVMRSGRMAFDCLVAKGHSVTMDGVRCDVNYYANVSYTVSVDSGVGFLDLSLVGIAGSWSLTFRNDLCAYVEDARCLDSLYLYRRDMRNSLLVLIVGSDCDMGGVAKYLAERGGVVVHGYESARALLEVVLKKGGNHTFLFNVALSIVRCDGFLERLVKDYGEGSNMVRKCHRLLDGRSVDLEEYRNGEDVWLYFGYQC